MAAVKACLPYIHSAKVGSIACTAAQGALLRCTAEIVLILNTCIDMGTALHTYLLACRHMVPIGFDGDGDDSSVHIAAAASAVDALNWGHSTAVAFVGTVESRQSWGTLGAALAAASAHGQRLWLSSSTS
jgi:hypothetical protein